MGSSATATAPLVRDRLTDPSNNHRIVLWKVALRQFRHHVLLGGGAGTFQTYYAVHRTDSSAAVDTHSLYLQTLGEDGLLGIVLLVIGLLGVLGRLAFGLRRRPRSIHVVLLAAGIAWAVHSAVDWDWQMPAVTLWLFAAGGLALASRPATAPRLPASVNRVGLAAAFLALAIAPLLIGFSYQRLRASGAALVSGDCTAARQRALSSISLLAVRPQAYEVLGYCDIEQEYPIEGLTAMRKAVSYDRQNWEAHYGLAIALAANGLNPLPEARRTAALNPLNPLAQDELSSFRGAPRSRWPIEARAVMLEGLQSQGLEVFNL